MCGAYMAPDTGNGAAGTGAWLVTLRMAVATRTWNASSWACVPPAASANGSFMIS